MSKTETCCCLDSTSKYVLSICVLIGCFLINGLATANIDRGRWIFHSDSGDEINLPLYAEVRGTPMVSLQDLAPKSNLSLTYDPDSFTVELRSKNVPSRWAKIRTYSGEVSGFWGISRLSHPPLYEGVQLLVPIEFGDRVLRPLLSGIAPPALPNQNQLSAATQVILDPGHGGNDWGAYTVLKGAKIKEKDLSLAFAIEVKKALTDFNIATAVLRETDLYLPLSERTKMLSDSNARLFISLHWNAHNHDDTNKKMRGYEIYVLSLKQDDREGRLSVLRENQMIPKDLAVGADAALAELRAESNFEKSLDWAKLFSAAMTKSGLTPLRKRPIRTGPFYVLYGAPMPALLLELGFIDNHADVSKFMQKSYQQRIAREIAQAIKQKIEPQIEKGHKQNNESILSPPSKFPQTR